MGEKSRTAYSLRNSAFGIAAKSIMLLGGYITRMLLVRAVTPDLVGLNGLLYTLLGGLMLANMGLDTAMAYSLFAPVAQGDADKQNALLRMYRRVYLCFSAAILLVGICLLFFLPAIVREEIDRKTVFLAFGLFLLNTLFSYQWAEKSMLFFARQKNYVNDVFSSVFYSAQYLAQCLILVWTKSFLLFLAAEVLCTALKNFCVSRYADRQYPFLKQAPASEISKEEKQSIARNIRAMLLHKSGYVIINNTDNMLLSAMFGIASVGSYSNYVLIAVSVSLLFTRIINGVGGSVGNIGVTESREHSGAIFHVVLFVACWIYGFGAVCLFVLLEPFVRLSFGEAYLLPQATTFVLCLNFYLNGVRKATLVFRDSLGLFRKDRYKTIVEGLVNLLASLLLARFMGITGVLVGTTVSLVTVSLWVEPLVLYGEYFQKPVREYFEKLLVFFLAAAASGAAAWAVCRAVPGAGLAAFVGKGALCAVIPNVLLPVIFRNRPEFKTLKKIILKR